MSRLSDELLHEAIDLHQHAAPSIFDRVTDDLGLALEARQRGMRAVLLKAHEQDTEQKALAAQGAVMEKTLIAMMPAWQSVSLAEMVSGIREVGVEHCVLATDFGQVHHPVPPEGLRMFVQFLLEQGLEPGEIRTMVADTPARFLGLPAGA